MACAQEAAQEVLHDVRRIEDPLLRQKVMLPHNRRGRCAAAAGVV